MEITKGKHSGRKQWLIEKKKYHGLVRKDGKVLFILFLVLYKSCSYNEWREESTFVKHTYVKLFCGHSLPNVLFMQEAIKILNISWISPKHYHNEYFLACISQYNCTCISWMIFWPDLFNYFLDWFPYQQGKENCTLLWEICKLRTWHLHSRGIISTAS